MTRPEGSFLAPVRNGVIHFPPVLKMWCEDAGWTLFRVTAETPHELMLHPVMAVDTSLDGFDSSFDPEGRLWIPAAIRERVSLGEQSVLIRLEGEVIRIFLRKVFEALGFGP